MNLSRRFGGDRGAVIPVVALSLAFLMAGTALSVDIGRLSHRRRDLQSVADAVALDAARRIDGRTTSELEPLVAATAGNTAARNRFLHDVDDELDTVLGVWDTSTSTFTPTAPGDVPNAVQVVARDTVPFYFQSGERTTERIAVAMRLLPTVPGLPGFGSVAGFELASFLARFHADLPESAELTFEREVKARWLDVVLGATLQTPLPDGQLGLTAVGYQGLASGWVALEELRAALRLGSVDQLLTSSVTLGDLLDAFLEVMDDQGNLAAYDALDQLRGAVDSSLTLTLGEMIRVAQGAEGAAGRAEFNLLDLVGGAATLVNGTNLLSAVVDTAIPNPLTPAVDTLQARIEAVVLEPPVFAFGPAARAPHGSWLTTAENSQVQLQVTVEVPGVTLPGLPSLVTVEVPIVLTGADATADLTRISCASLLDETTTRIETVTRAVDAFIGIASDLTVTTPVINPAPLVTVGGIPVEGYVAVAAGGGSDVLEFPLPGVPWGSPENRRTAAGGTDVDITGRLVTNLSTGVTGLDGPMTQSLVNQLDVALADVDALLLRPLAESLGVNLGGADVMAKNPPDCAVPVLVG